MPYLEQTEFEIPDQPHSKFWRYMSLAKFLSILQEGSLYFSSLRLIREYVDHHEGELTQADWDFLTEHGGKEGAEETRLMFQYFADLCFINCWHVNETESISMWERYLKHRDGVAVKTDFYRICESLKDYPEPISIGMVQYKDFKTFTTHAKSALPYVILKRREYADEREIRMIYMPEIDLGSPAFLEDLEEASNNLRHQLGYPIPVDLNVLLEQVVVSPYSQDWLVDLLKKFMKQSGLDPNIVIHSQINYPPIFE